MVCYVPHTKIALELFYPHFLSQYTLARLSMGQYKACTNLNEFHIDSDLVQDGTSSG